MLIARNDCFGVEDLGGGIAVRRRVMAGDQIPPGLEVAAGDLIEVPTDELERMRRLSVGERLAVLEAKASAADDDAGSDAP